MIKPLFDLEKEDEALIDDVFKKLHSTSKPQVLASMKEWRDGYLITLVVAAADWPGLVDTVTGIVHEKGLNISFIYGIMSEDEKNACLLSKIFIKEKINREDLEKTVRKLKSLIKSFAKGGHSIKKVLSLGVEKIEILEMVKKELKKILSPEEQKAVFAPGGELEIFIISRSEAYLKERRPEDLAKIIATNYRFIKRLRERGMGIEVTVDNIKTTKEKLSAITVAGFERELSIDDVFDSLRDFLPDFKRKYDKQFITPDGITVIRIEFTDAKDKPLRKEDLELLEAHLKRTLVVKKFRSPLNVKVGAEILGRMIIPRIIDDCNSSGVTQVYILPVDVSRNSVSFRITIATKDPNVYDKLVDNFARIKGFYLITYKAPTKVKEIYIMLFMVRAMLDKFRDEMEIYDKLKNILKESLGDFRDFDEGMRVLDRRKLEKLMAQLTGRGVTEKLIRYYFFSMDDFYRASLSFERLRDDILFVHTLLRAYFKNKTKIGISEYRNSFLLGIVSPIEELNLENLINLVKDFNPLLVRFEIYGVNVIVFEIKKREDLDIEKLLDDLKKEVKYEGNIVRY